MKIAVIGTGYVGLVTGTCFADSGNHVICVDNNPDKLDLLRQGEVPIYEPGLETLFKRAIREKRITFTDDLSEAVKQSDILFLCLPTPPGADGQADLSAVVKVAEQIGDLIDDYKVIVNKSTVPVGTADKVRLTIESRTSVPFDVVSNPEFLREGAAVNDFQKPERVVIGTSSDRAAELMKELYDPFVRSGNPIIIMDERSSEMTKYAANGFLATKITFMNEIANICERVGANVDHVRRGIGTDSRIGKRFLFAGIGFGGSCFPKDVQALHYTAKENDYNFRILDAVQKVNDSQKLSIVEKIKKFYNGQVKGRTFGVWGLTFKPETDDVREAPAIYIIQALIGLGAHVKAYDPEARKTFPAAVGEEISSQIDYVEDQTSALQDVDALIISTEWNEFRRPDFDNFIKLMKEPVIFDGRNLYDLERMEELNITYFSVGRRGVNVNRKVTNA
ncbi:UDP-glucose dehydrogenase family protein [Natronogracilivirga saccharolytica]|uniref:UDP-glucose 6-dehydrogenase n=1 Tax=Natronogracilivirga saccharolytica TaxID=2812953 RepID=A0A8J7RLR5_9BACT|nr:UDP-glucose/GDP-mannose dehydrogenase family protein [Natronogracilivirga saccharolytica]MBP3193687.1 UDP-glucose/GDP-mannose dehydrogenase family protein [Natronogracilivirga saccharolytica]